MLVNCKPIRTDDDHRDAVRDIETLWGAPEGTAEGDRLEVLATLVDAYENQRWPTPSHDPVQAIEAAMQHEGRTRADLAKLIGKSRASEVLRRKRALTLPMIRRIAREWHVPERLLVPEYAVGSANP